MPTRFQAVLVHRTRGQQVPTLRLLKTGFYEAQIENRPRLAGGWFGGLWVVGGAGMHAGLSGG